MDRSPSEYAQLKKAIRAEALARRDRQADRPLLSRRICNTFVTLPEYDRAKTVMFYVDFRSEVQTQQTLPIALASGKEIVVPWCLAGELELFRLRDLRDLAPGMYDIPEPREDMRLIPERRASVEDLDLIMVPGVAFDRQGGRIGLGAGYYDKLLENALPETSLVGLAFECQIVPEVPMQPHDVSVDKVITENGIYVGKGRRS